MAAFELYTLGFINASVFAYSVESVDKIKPVAVRYGDRNAVLAVFRRSKITITI